MPHFLKLQPEYKPRVWGGQLLMPGTESIGEAWIVWEHNKIVDGVFASYTLKDVTEKLGVDLLGTEGIRHANGQFPLLIKLLDCADWLSIQVHPDDTQAEILEGEGYRGKTEAWHILEAVPEARIIAGVRPEATPEIIHQAILDGNIETWSQYHSVQTGDTVFMPAGTLHALGPGIFVYEVQQASDLTYRVFDWNRTVETGRVLHLEQSLVVTNPESQGFIQASNPQNHEREEQRLVSCDFFTLSLLSGASLFKMNTREKTFHALTIIEGDVEIKDGQNSCIFHSFDTVIIPACVGNYSISPLRKCRILKASIENEF